MVIDAGVAASTIRRRGPYRPSGGAAGEEGSRSIGDDLFMFLSPVGERLGEGVAHGLRCLLT
jgi:hypothetical protein